MILNSIAKSIRTQNWSVVLIELLVVVIGLVLAFQADRWWEERGDRAREAEYISRLVTEVSEDIVLIRHAIDLAQVRQGFGDLLLEVAEDPEVAQQQPSMFLVAAAQAAFTYTPTLITHTFDDLRSTGSMGLIRSEEIKKALYSYYSFDQSQQQYMQLNLNIEMRYFELAAEVLDAAQYQWVQDRWFVVTRNDLEDARQAEPDPERLDGAIKRFVGNRELIAWLPRTRGVQREQILMHRIRLNRAEELLERLQNYSAQLAGTEPGS